MPEEAPATVPLAEPVADLAGLTAADLADASRSVLVCALRRRIEERADPGCASVAYQRALR